MHESPTYNDIIPVLAAAVGHTMAKVSASLTGYVKITPIIAY